MKPIISVIVTCYNYAPYVAECLTSIAQQTFTDWECLVVDDGSTDDSKSNILPFVENDPRFHYIWQENGNVSSARNNGLNRANGEYVISIDADDKISGNFLSSMLERMEKQPELTLVYPEVHYFGEMKGLWVLPDYSFVDMLGNNMIVVSALHRKKDFERIGGYDVNMKTGSEDWEYWIRLLADNRQVAKEPTAILYYRIKPGSKHVSLLSDQHKRTEMYRYISRKHQSVYNEYFESPLVLHNDLLMREHNYFHHPFRTWYAKILSKLKEKF